MFSKSKKIISFIISFLMLFSFGSVSFATNEMVDESVKIVEETEEFKKYEVVTPDGEIEYIIEKITNDESMSFEIIGNDYSAFVEKDGNKISVFDEKNDLVEEILISDYETINQGEDLSLNPLGSDSFFKARAYYPTAWRLQSSYNGSRSGDLGTYSILLAILSGLLSAKVSFVVGVASAIYGKVARVFYYKRKTYFRITGPKSWQYKYITDIYKHSNHSGFLKTAVTYQSGYGS